MKVNLVLGWLVNRFFGYLFERLFSVFYEIKLNYSSSDKREKRDEQHFFPTLFILLYFVYLTYHYINLMLIHFGHRELWHSSLIILCFIYGYSSTTCKVISKFLLYSYSFYIIQTIMLDKHFNVQVYIMYIKFMIILLLAK